ncbi:MAG: hypothetical protein ACRD5W_13615 [Candidatus Acidiferrales bacterium]
MGQQFYVPPDNERCTFTTADSKRCRYPRAGAETNLCGTHLRDAARDAASAALLADQAAIGAEILPEGESLDTATAINAALTRLFRCVLEGRVANRQAAILAYVGQLLISTLPGMVREAANAPKHPLLGSDPEAVFAEIARSLRSSFPPVTPSTSDTEVYPAVASATPAHPIAPGAGPASAPVAATAASESQP